MKTIIISLAFLLTGLSSRSQDLTTAFSKSYEYEYALKYDKAIEALMTVYVAENYEINLRLGWLYYASKDYPKSITYYSKATSIEASSIESRLGLVNPLAALNNWEQIIKVYRDILKIDPNQTTVNYRLAYLLYQKKEFTEALGFIKTTLKLYPFDYDGNLLAGKIYVSLGKVKEARLHFQRALTYNPLSAEAKEALSKL